MLTAEEGDIRCTFAGTYVTGFLIADRGRGEC
jgi:hypothetical protein